MKTRKNILIAFLLNLLFAILEFFGGILTGSVAIISDSIHDLGDAASIGVSYFLELKSKKKPDDKYTNGYLRFSVLGGLITTLILLVGSILVIVGAVNRIINPVTINYNGMIIFAVFGVIINFLAAYVTRVGDSINQKAVNLHMLEDVLGWLVVLIGAVVMRFTDFYILDPILSIGVALFIMVHSLKNLKEVLDLFLEKKPEGIDIEEIKHHILEIEEVKEIHHIHIWSIDGVNNFITFHAVAEGDYVQIKKKIREELAEHNITHSVIEFENYEECCDCETCDITELAQSKEHHHHHH